MLLYYSLAVALPFLSFSAAQTQTEAYPANLVGTWSTKSNQTLTGPGFYDPFKEELIEPSLTGISYSFTNDGHYEEAYYRAVANPQDPACPQGIMQWQHGQYFVNANGSLTLQPIEVDGRQLLSDPCNYDNGIYTRYNQSELISSYRQYTDPYHNIPRLDLFRFDGAQMNAMYLAFSPPQMLPTTTLHPLTSATASATGSSKKSKRGLETEVLLNWKMGMEKNAQTGDVVHHINADRLWWIGLGMTGIGGLLYLAPRTMGRRLS